MDTLSTGMLLYIKYLQMTADGFYREQFAFIPDNVLSHQPAIAVGALMYTDGVQR